MSPEQLCSRIARDLDYLAVEFIHNGHRSAACDVMHMTSTLFGELLGEDESPMQAAQELTAAAEGRLS